MNKITAFRNVLAFACGVLVGGAVMARWGGPPLDLASAVVQAQTSKDRKSTRLNSSHIQKSRMPSSA